MKIAISGTAGIGKTTLAKALAENLELGFIDENYEAFFEKKRAMRQKPVVAVEIFHSVFSHKQTLENDLKTFVTDRCPLDLFHLWLIERLGDMDKRTEEFHTLCFDAAQVYDYVILPPWGSIELKQIENPTNQKRRVMNGWVQLKNHATISGYAHLWLAPEKIIQLPASLNKLEQRIDYIINEIQRREK